MTMNKDTVAQISNAATALFRIGKAEQAYNLVMTVGEEWIDTELTFQEYCDYTARTIQNNKDAEELWASQR
jgi:hypothetical protein